MKITAEIISVGQRVDFETSNIVNTMDVALPDGAVITVRITEEDMQRLVFLHTGAVLEPTTKQTTPSPPPEPPDDEDDVTIFGGAATEYAKESARPVEAHRSAMVPPPMGRVVRTVAKDEMGNPIVPGIANLVDLPPDSGVDEDGVPAA